MNNYILSFQINSKENKMYIYDNIGYLSKIQVLDFSTITNEDFVSLISKNIFFLKERYDEIHTKLLNSQGEAN